MVDFFSSQQRAPRREAERLKTLAESLQEGGKYRGNEMVSGQIVKQSPLEHIARGLQTAAGGYFAGQSQNKADEDERMMQERIASALSQWGENPQGAAMMLAQDPRTSDMAMQLMSGEVDYSRQKERWQQEDALKRELMQQRASFGGGNVPAPMQIANKMFELEQTMSNPNLPEDQRFLAQRQYNLLGQSAKTYGFDRGLQADGMTGYDAVYGGQQPIEQLPIGGQSFPPDQGYDPVSAHAAAVQNQQANVGINPNQRPELRQPVISEIQGYGDAAANIAAKKKAAETTAASDAQYMAEGRQALPKIQRSLQDAEIRSQNIMRVSDQIAQNAQNAFTTGFTGTIAGAVPGTPAYDLKNNLQTLEATAAFDTLQNMRDNSPTGGALGQVSERELDLLKAAYSNLSNSQSYEQFVQNLNAFNRQNQASMRNARAAYEQDYQRFGGQNDQFLPQPSGLNQSGNLQRDQVSEYLRSKGMGEPEIEQYLNSKGL